MDNEMTRQKAAEKALEDAGIRFQTNEDGVIRVGYAADDFKYVEQPVDLCIWPDIKSILVLIGTTCFYELGSHEKMRVDEAIRLRSVKDGHGFISIEAIGNCLHAFYAYPCAADNFEFLPTMLVAMRDACDEFIEGLKAEVDQGKPDDFVGWNLPEFKQVERLVACENQKSLQLIVGHDGDMEMLEPFVLDLTSKLSAMGKIKKIKRCTMTDVVARGIKGPEFVAGRFEKSMLHCIEVENLSDFSSCDAQRAIRAMADNSDGAYIVVYGNNAELDKLLTAADASFQEIYMRVQLPDTPRPQLIEEYLSHLDSALGADRDIAEMACNQQLGKVSVMGLAGARHLASLANATGKIGVEEKQYEDPRMLVEKIFEGVVGKDELKSQLVRIAQGHHLRNALVQHDGVAFPPQRTNFVFVGNPGTGKSMCAELVARFLCASNILEGDVVRSCSARDLVSKWVGDTQIKTSDLLKSADCIVVDEAYSMQSDHAKEALAEIAFELGKASPCCRCVIFAGYTDEMMELLDTNPGLRSRFSHVIEFEDYSIDELVEIFMSKCNAAGVGVSPDALLKVKKILAKRAADSSRSFGNAREAENLFADAFDCLADELRIGQDLVIREKHIA